ncbi:GYF domain-containing protein [Lysobacter terrae]
MIDWYYHAPGEGRVGPLSANDLRELYQERRIQRDTLVWHHGLREWQPLERLEVEIGILGMQQDTSAPPPMPSNAPAPIAPQPIRTAPRGKYTRAPLREKKTLSGGAIALIAIAVIVIPGAMILGSIMLSSYKDYAQRATSIGKVQGIANGLKQVVADYALRSGRCPVDGDPGVTQLQSKVRQQFAMNVSFERTGNGCAFEVAFNADGKPIDGKALRYEGHAEGDGFAWECRGGDMPDNLRPRDCRSGG